MPERNKCIPTYCFVPGDGLLVGLDSERRGLEPGRSDVLQCKLDEVVEVPADTVELSTANKDLPNSTRGFCTFPTWPAGVSLC